MWTLAHRRLQEACIYLFPEPRDCRVLVSDCGMDASQINFEEPPALRWQSVINEAEKQNAMGKLVPTLLARYPDNAQLIAACKPFEAADPVAAPPVTKPKTEPTVPKGAVLVKKFEPETKSVPLQAPEETATIVIDDAEATIASLRLAAAAQEKRLVELEQWRIRISTMSSAKLSVASDGDVEEK